MEIIISHIYPELLDLYGDRGNIEALKYRMSKRGIDVVVNEYKLGDTVDIANTDIMYIGGGNDTDTVKALNELTKRKDEYRAYADNMGTILALGSGYEMLGKSLELNGESYEGLGIFDMQSKKSSKRYTGNVILCSAMLASYIVGFENHNSCVYLNNVKALGDVKLGYGNNENKDKEGCVYNNAIGSFLSGPILPKNSALTDHLILSAVERKYLQDTLEDLDNNLEIKAQEYIIDKYLD